MTRLFGFLLIAALAMPAYGQFVDIDNGLGQGTNGHLRVGVDAYGSWASAGFGGTGDTYNPTGGGGQFAPKEAAFTSGFFIFTGNGRELLSESGDWQGTFGPDATLDRQVTAPVAAAGDTATSSFRVFGSSVDLGFDVRQVVSALPNDAASITQTYVITNNATVPTDFSMVRAFDGDLLWDSGGGDFADDEVGTESVGSGAVSVFMQEENAPGVTRVTMSGSNANDYYGGKNGIDPNGGGVPFGFGTDVQVWDNFGIPFNWRDFIAGVGQNMNGTSGTNPPGSDPTTPDGFIGMDFNFALAAGETTTLVVTHTYGVPEPTSGLMLMAGLMGLGVLRRRS